MKRILFLLLCALLLTGCLPTPEVEIIPNKGDQKDWQVEAVPYVPEEASETAAPDHSPAPKEQQGGPL